jgi:molybdopterin/thiamine biosynthesis adenylyltransferase
MRLTEEQIQRYSRPILVPDFGGVSQKRVLAATAVVIVRPGRLATHYALLYLIGAGVGRVELNQREACRTTAEDLIGSPILRAEHVGRDLGEALHSTLAGRNPDVELTLGCAPAAPGALDLPQTDSAAQALEVASRASLDLLLHWTRPE